MLVATIHCDEMTKKSIKFTLEISTVWPTRLPVSMPCSKLWRITSLWKQVLHISQAL